MNQFFSLLMQTGYNRPMQNTQLERIKEGSPLAEAEENVAA